MELKKECEKCKKDNWVACCVCGKPSQYGGCENCYYNTVGINEKVELGEKSLYEAIKDGNTAEVASLEAKAQAGEIIRIM